MIWLRNSEFILKRRKMIRSFSSGRNIIFSFLFNGVIILILYKIIELIIYKKDLFMIPILILPIILICLIWYSPLKYIVENGSFYIISGWKESRKIPVSSFTTIKKSNT